MLKLRHNLVAVEKQGKPHAPKQQGLISSSIETTSNRGIIVSVGPDAKDLEVGQKVLFSESHKEKITLGGRELYIMEEGYVLGTIEENKSETAA